VNGSPAGRVVAGRTARRAARSGALWGLVFGAYVASSALGFASTYPTAASRAKLATSLGGNAGLAALLGPARHIGTVAGFTAWRAMAVLSVVGAIWALFLASRLLRGEEDAGRWELYLCGPTTRGRAAAQAVVGLGAGVGALWTVTAVLTVAIGGSSKAHFAAPSSLYLATCLVAAAAMFTGAGALLSELAANRRQANGLGAGIIGASFLVRMVADSTPGLAWLRWASPLGWTEQLHPLTGSHPLALLPIGALAVGAAVAAAVVAAGRDLGASAFPSRDSRPPHTALLARPAGLAARLIRPVFIGWAVGLAVMGFILGLVSQAAAGAINGSSTIQQAINRLGGHGAGGVKAYLGIALGIGAALIALAAAGQVNATRLEEATERVEHLLVRPVSRSRWLVGRMAVAATLVVAISLVCGLGAWLGLATQGGGVGLGSFLEAGLNLAPPGLAVLGLGVLAYGVVPRVASRAAYVVVGWSFLVQLIATLVTNNRLLLDSSVLTHLAPVPATSADWTSMAGLVLVGALAAGVGVLGFRGRDLAGE